MSNESSERICPGCGVSYGQRNPADFCDHRCPTTAEADAQREPELLECDHVGCPNGCTTRCGMCTECIRKMLATRSRPTVAEIRRQAFDDAIKECERYRDGLKGRNDERGDGAWVAISRLTNSVKSIRDAAPAGD